MSNVDEYDDDYVAKLLAEDAKKSSANYAARGLSAFLPKRPTSSAPKPNTRFLSHIVREADNHNASLKQKEELEARIRLREMHKDSSRKRERDRYADSRDRKRRRYSDSEDERPRRSRHSERHRDESPKQSEPRRKSSRGNKEINRRLSSSRLSSEDEKRQDKPSKEKWSTNRKDNRRFQRNARTDSISPAANSNNEHCQNRILSEDESDPLEDIVGPMPPKTKHSPINVRGRGALKSRSNIDDHFSDNYDPTQDIQPNSDSEGEHDDWDMALEALRDRAMWKKKQSERLREAGWDDAQIQKWEKGSMNHTEEDPDLSRMKWTKRGEERAWDAGKEVTAIPDRLESTKESSGSHRKRSDHEDAWQRKNNGFLKGLKKAIG